MMLVAFYFSSFFSFYVVILVAVRFFAAFHSGSQFRLFRVLHVGALLSAKNISKPNNYSLLDEFRFGTSLKWIMHWWMDFRTFLTELMRTHFAGSKYIWGLCHASSICWIAVCTLLPDHNTRPHSFRIQPLDKIHYFDFRPEYTYIYTSKPHLPSVYH